MSEKKFKILIIGDSMLDEYVLVNHERISPEAPVPILDEFDRVYKLGGAANVALNVNALGAEAFLISMSGNDEGGSKLVNELNLKGIKYNIITDESRPTTLKTRFVNKEYEQFFRLDREDESDISESKFEEFEAIINASIEANNFDAIILQDYNKGLCTVSLIKKVQKKSRENDLPLFVDPKKNNFKLLSDCDFFKPNLTEVKQFLDLEKEEDLDKILAQICSETLDQKNLIITLGSLGMFCKNVDNQAFIEGHNVINADVSGAGDTVISSICFFYLKGFNLAQIAKLANKAGAISCQKRGISSVSLEEIENFNADVL